MMVRRDLAKIALILLDVLFSLPYDFEVQAVKHILRLISVH